MQPIESTAYKTYKMEIRENFHNLHEIDRTSFDLAAELHRDTPSNARHLPYCSMCYPLQDAVYQVYYIYIQE